MSESPCIFYEPQELAQIIVNYNMDNKQSKAFINNIWKNESKYLYPDYQEDLEQFRDDVMEVCRDRQPLQAFNDEFPEISFDIKKAHKGWDTPLYHDIRFFLINLRLRILYIQKAPDVRTNMKLLLKKYGYRRRNATMVRFMDTTIIMLDLPLGYQTLR